MNVYLYDGSYEGLLTTVFESFSSKITPAEISCQEHYQPLFTGHTLHVVTDEKKAERVLKGIMKKTSPEATDSILKAFLSETPDMEMLIYQYIKYLIEAKENVEENYSNPYVLKMKQLRKQVNREVHRMHAFVRFEKTSGDIYHSVIDPDFNVIPLIGEHFEKRYADQKWIIFDTKRKYGIYYDLETITALNSDMLNTYLSVESLISEKENAYQHLWKNYFDAVNIKERKNVKFHLQQLPKRYWKFLPEKKM